jgi:hypothetical protein
LVGFATTNFTPGAGADIVMESITLIFRLLTDAPEATRTESSRNLSEMAWLQKLRPLPSPAGR